MAGSSKKAIYGAIIANSLIAISKFIAGSLTGSASMLSEGIHSLVDTGNGALLLFGIRKSKKPADHQHPYGYGNEVYFWSFVVAVLIFALGGGIALFEGIEAVLHHYHRQDEVHSIPLILYDNIWENPKFWNYFVLILAMIFEGFALKVALTEFNKTRGDKSFYQELVDSKDTSTAAIVIEDTAALLGLMIALISVTLTDWTGIIYFDGLGSICIGILLVCVSLFFATECKDLLIGEGLMEKDLKLITDILDQDEHVVAYKRPLSLYFGPNEVLVNLDANFKDNLNADAIEATIDRIEKAIKKAIPAVNRIFIEAETIKSTSKTN
jgi:cation diffusion facilitator family transporter